MEQLIAMKFILASVEETIKSILMVKKKFDLELFRLVLKKNVYEILSDEDYTIGVEEILKKACINYDIGSDKVDDDISGENVEEFEIEIEIPISSIVEAVERMIERGEIDNIYSERDLMRDLVIINDIWNEWVPIDDFSKTSKDICYLCCAELTSE